MIAENQVKVKGFCGDVLTGRKGVQAVFANEGGGR